MKPNPITNAGELIDALGGNAAVEERTQVHYQTVVGWRRRNRIPVDYWPALQAMGTARGVEVNNDLLVALTSPRKSAAA